MRHLITCSLALIAGLSFAADGSAPKDAIASITLPTGFSAQLVAAEPDIRQPVAFTIDDRGRLWVLENLNYPECPGKPQNRIVILEDSTGDGSKWTQKVFADNLTFATGIQVGFGGVYVGAPPNLHFYADKNGDDKPDAAPEVLLDGWGREDTHETLNNFTWGPDGWLYGTHGVFTKSKVGAPGTPDDQRIKLNAAVWRFHPTTRKFELHCEGASNQWGIDWNDHGQAFFTACVIPHLYHAIQGARYQRQAGQHFNQATYADLKTITTFKYERAAYCGATIYLGGLFPADYRDTLIFNDIHMSKIRNEKLVAKGSGFINERRPDFAVASDSWFRTLSVQYGPDGGVFVNDWFDKVHCHQQRAETDRSNGRIYKIGYQGIKPTLVDLAQLDDAKLVELHLNTNEWYVRHARRLLQERGPKPAVHAALAKILTDNQDDTRQLRALWTLHATKGLTETLALAQFKRESPYVRAWTIQLLCEDQAPSPTVLGEFARLAKDDPSPVVRLYLASALQRMPVEARWPIATALAAHAEDNSDANLPLLLWYGIEPAVATDRKQSLTLMKASKIDCLREFIPKRIGVSDLLTEVSGADIDLQRSLLSGVLQGMLGVRSAPPPAIWAELAPTLTASDDARVRLTAQHLGALFGDVQAVAALRVALDDRKAAVSDRRRALRALLHVRAEGLQKQLIALLDDASLRPFVLPALAEQEDPATPGAITAVYAALSIEERIVALNTLVSRVSYARSLIAALGAGIIPARDLTASVLRQLTFLKDAEIMHFTVAQRAGPDQDALAEVERLKGVMTKDVLAQGDRTRGKVWFERACAQCHALWGGKGTLGPDLTGLNRPDLDWVLKNVIDPSIIMGSEQRILVARLKDGRVVAGMKREDAATYLTLQNEAGLLTVSKAEISTLEQTKRSTMPDGLLRPFTTAELADFLAYLQGNGPLAGAAP